MRVQHTRIQDRLHQLRMEHDRVFYSRGTGDAITVDERANGGLQIQVGNFLGTDDERWSQIGLKPMDAKRLRWFLDPQKD